MTPEEEQEKINYGLACANEAYDRGVAAERADQEKARAERVGFLVRNILGPAPGPFEFKVIVEFGRKLNNALIPVDVVLHSGDRFRSIGTVVCKMLDDMVSPTFEGPKT